MFGLFLNEMSPLISRIGSAKSVSNSADVSDIQISKGPTPLSDVALSEKANTIFGYKR